MLLRALFVRAFVIAPKSGCEESQSDERQNESTLCGVECSERMYSHSSARTASQRRRSESIHRFERSQRKVSEGAAHGCTERMMLPAFRTALHYCVENSSPNCIRLLISFAGDLNVTDMSSLTPLHYCALYNGEESLQELLDVPNIKVQAVDQNKRLPLHYAAASGNVTILSALSDVSSRDVTDRSTLCFLVRIHRCGRYRRFQSLALCCSER